MTNAPRDLISARDIDRLPRGATLRVSPRAIITPWARDRAAIRGVTITTCEAAPEEAPTPTPTPMPAAAPHCGCSTPAAEPTPKKPAGPAWVSPFENRIIRGPNVAVLLGAAGPAKGGY